MIRQIVGLHVAYNTILCTLKCIIALGKCIILLLAGTWHQICNTGINNRPVPYNIIFITNIISIYVTRSGKMSLSRIFKYWGY